MALSTSTDGEGTSLGERLRWARVAAGLSTRALADRLAPQFKVSHATIANYERGATPPDLAIVGAIASEVGRPLQWFLQSGPALQNVKYRNRKSLVSQTACVQFEFCAKTWFDAYVFVEQRINEPLKKLRSFDLRDFQQKQPERAAKALREALKLRADDPVQSVPQVMEQFGIRVIEVDTDEAIDGLAARYAGEYVTALVRGLAGDRGRMNAAHEFGHFIAGDIDTESADPVADARAFEFASHLLMPAPILKRAIDRQSMVHLVEMKRLYGISLAAMVYRAEKAGFLTTADAKRIWIEFAKRGWRQNEPGRIAPDRALRFEILFESALSVGKVSFEDVSKRSGIAIADLRRRLNEPVGFLDEEVPRVDPPEQGMRLAR